MSIHLTDAGRELEVHVASVQRRLYERVDMDGAELATLRQLAQRFSRSAAHLTGPTTDGAPR